MSQTTIKHVTRKNERDKLVIEALIWRRGPLSRPELHELTHLQRSHISRLVRELQDEGRLIQAGQADNPMGRKRTLLRLNEEHRFVVAVGFDDQEVLAATMDLHLRMRSTVKESTHLDGGTEGLLNQLLCCTKKAIRQSGVNVKALLGIGAAGSGLVNNREGMLVMSSTIEFLKQVPLRETFEKEFGVPTSVENLTRAKALAERTLGAGVAADDMIYVEYGRTGIGAGIIINGRLFYGSEYAAGEFGHTHMIQDGPACKCGSFGCLEAIAGAAALEARIRKALAEGSSSEALALAEGDSSKISGWTVLKAAHLGDKTCSAIVEQAGNYLGLGLANLVNLFNPSVLVLDQRLSYAGEGLLEQITRVVKRQALSHSAKNLLVRFGKLGSEASVLGAGSVLLEKHFEIPALKLPRFMIEPVSMPFRRSPTARILGT
jgi:predicted NBD/HSP70 family sugar kinase